ncbi:MAG TPA: exonuclease domain-containing protein [Cellvibrio sp.]|nr:exonuclease domain-containing protein [Cellvibrio sp.]
MLKSIPLPAVLIDVETTGGNVTFDRVTEIGIVEIYENEVREWSTLINPGIRIPLGIQQLTGITDAMVASAPRFEQVAKEILQRIKGKLFIAHNVRFDYGFIRNEFARLAYAFKAPLMCTVKLSRALYADRSGHSLEKIIARHQIFVSNRHRALDDAKATYKFMEIAEQEHGIESFRLAVKNQYRKQSLPAYLDSAVIAKLPNQPGVYYFWGENKELLYIGKSIDIRKRVLSHFTSDHKASKEMRICQQTRDITWDTTAGELSALILESQKIKQLQPLLNRRLRRTSQLHTILLQENKMGWLTPEIAPIESSAHTQQKLYGLFPSIKKAKDAIKLISDEYKLCYCACGLEPITTRPCLRYQLKKCSGLCAGTEHYLNHNIQMLQGFAELALKSWPYKGPVALIETHADQESTQHLIINNWCVLGVTSSEWGYQDIINGVMKPSLDRDIYKYLVNAIFGKSSRLKIYPIAG